MDEKELAQLQSVVTHWKAEIQTYEKDKRFQKWHEKRGREVEKRYLDERDDSVNDTNTTKFNILWSNVETLFPAVYAKIPKPEVARRYNDRDPLGRIASTILERALEYEIQYYSDFDSGLKSVVEDRLLPGRGTAWIRYEPTFGQTPIQISEDDEGDYIDSETNTRFNYTDESGNAFDHEDVQMDEEGNYFNEYTENEKTCVDYVNWEDFGHCVARTWEEVPGVWRKVYLDKSEVKSRFESVAAKYGYEVSEIPFAEDENTDESGRPTTPATNPKTNKKTCIYEIWDKTKKRVIWLHKNVTVPLDIVDDPLEINDFWPCPKPLLATTSTSTLCPVPDFCQYQDQAQELDAITSRIDSLVSALKVVGVYDSEQDGIKRMLNHGLNNELIPVTTWNAFSEKGGIKGCVDFMPLSEVVGALQQAYQARDEIKQVIYEITGISDIVRGATAASETATAQQIKSNFANLRIRRLQTAVETFARDLLRIKAEIICRFYSDKTILGMANVDSFTEQDQMMIPQAIQLLRDDVARNFKIGIETDSLIELDQQQEQKRRTEFLSSAGGFLREATFAAKEFPQLGPLLGEMLMFGVRGFKAGRTMESTFEETVENMKNAPPPTQPDAEVPPPVDPTVIATNEGKMMEIQRKGELAQFQHNNKMKELTLQKQMDDERELRKIQESDQNMKINMEETSKSFLEAIAPILAQSNQAILQQQELLLEGQKELQLAVQNLAMVQASPRELIRDENGEIQGARLVPQRLDS